MAAVALAGSHAAAAPQPAGLTDAEIAAIRATSRERADAFFRNETGKPFAPAAIKKDWNGRGDYTRNYNHSVLLFAARAFQLGEQIPEANRALREMCEYHLARRQTLLEIHSFPWALSHLPVLCRLHGPDGTRSPGRISTDTHDLILRTMWEWAREKSAVADAEFRESRTWHITNSENHHANHFSSCWGATLLLSRDPRYRDRPLGDGRTARGHHEAWTAYLREYIRERARKGMTIEIDSPSYALATLTAIQRIHELTDDPALRRLSGDYLTLFWALWAEHQIDGVGGGAKTRCYPDSSQRGTDFLRRGSWYLLGMGDPGFTHSSMLTFVLGGWRIPDVVVDIACDPRGRGTYETRQRRPGLADPAHSKPPDYRMRHDAGGILRHGFCTPDFVMGSLLTEARPEEDWAAISSQNRWCGVIFRGDPDARIYPAATNRAGESVYNGLWSAQAHGTLIAQRLERSRRADEWRVFFSKAGLKPAVREGRWLFTEAPGAWAAVQVVRGDFSEVTGGKDRFGRWIRCADRTSPVILEVARKEEFGTAEMFRRAVLSLPTEVKGNALRHTGLKGDRFVLPLGQDAPPLINGRPTDLAPKRVYDSPFVQSDWDSGVVTLQKGARRLVLDFNK